MSATLLNDALRLPAKRRLALAQKLLDSIPATESPLSPAQKTLLSRRVAAYKKNPEAVLTWDQVESQIINSQSPSHKKMRK